MSDILIKAVEEIVRNAKKVYEESVANLPLVEKATVCCTSSDPDDAVLEVHKNVKTRNQYNGAEGLNESDIKLQPETFGKCKCTGEECVPDILDSRWENCMPLMEKQGLQRIRIWYALMADLSFR